ncbi:hypothetical protein KQI84_12170 [bacterium]|nr:hypothetical protein [bacterium]
MSRRFAHLLLICLIAITAIGCSRAKRDANLKANAPTGTAEFGLWVQPETAAESFQTVAEATAFFDDLKEQKVSTVFLQVKDRQGDVIFATKHAAAIPGAEHLLANAARGANAAGVQLIAAYPVFVGNPRPGEELIEYTYDESAGHARVQPRESGPLPRLNPSIRAVRDRELAILRELAAVPVDGFCLTHAGYPGSQADFSDEARAGFEAAMARPVKVWPDDILGFRPGEHRPVAEPGDLWEAWVSWRASLLRDFLFQAQGALTVGTEVRRPVLIMAEGYYPLHYRQGVNWASPAASVQKAFPSAPPRYGGTGTGAIFDGVVLELLAPIPTIEEAVANEMAWWSSAEGASRLASELLPPDATRWAAVTPMPFADSEGNLSSGAREAFLRSTHECARANPGVLVLDLDYMNGWGLWADVQGALAR